MECIYCVVCGSSDTMLCCVCYVLAWIAVYRCKDCGDNVSMECDGLDNGVGVEVKVHCSSIVVSIMQY